MPEGLALESGKVGMESQGDVVDLLTNPQLKQQINYIPLMTDCCPDLRPCKDGKKRQQGIHPISP
jgi:hypothetical protein